VSRTIWLAVDTLCYPEGGGHLWFYLNFALGLRSLGCQVIWLEPADPDIPIPRVRKLIATLKHHLRPYGLADSVAVCSPSMTPLAPEAVEGCVDLEASSEADLLLNMAYASCSQIYGRFRRTALIDCDTGLLQIWMKEGQIEVPRHDIYFTTGEGVGKPWSRVPDAGLEWHYTPYCVSLEWWPVTPAPPDAPFTTISHWSTSKEWVVYGEECYHNDKRSGFEPFFDLPLLTKHPLELALCLNADEQMRLEPDAEEERQFLASKGWRYRHSYTVSSTPWDYQKYIQSSRGEWSGAKPSCVRLQNAWLSDRTLAYLASGKPAVIVHTGPSSYLPDAAGIFRFRTVEEAARYIDLAVADYDNQCRLARAMAEEYFDAPKVMGKILERALA
jgi:hypothetical protein